MKSAFSTGFSDGDHSICRDSQNSSKVQKLKTKIAVVALLIIFYAQWASAYIDPNIAGDFFQVLYPVLAIFIGFLLFFPKIIMKFLRKIGSLFSGGKKEM